jgi:transcriptional regulator with XRE-family HTH domain
MPPGRSPGDLRDAVRLLERDAERFGDEFREHRLRIRATLTDVARLIGVATSVVWRIEHGDPTVSLEIRSRAARAIGGASRLTFYADSTPLLYDSAQARMAERVLSIAHPRWQAGLEVRVPGPGRRRVDIALQDVRQLVLMECESRVRRWEEALRELHDERDAFAASGDGRMINVVLVLPPTRHHRDLVRILPASVRAALPVDSSELRRALVEGTPWPGDGILWVGASKRTTSGGSPVGGPVGPADDGRPGDILEGGRILRARAPIRSFLLEGRSIGRIPAESAARSPGPSSTKKDPSRARPDPPNPSRWRKPRAGPPGAWQRDRLAR